MSPETHADPETYAVWSRVLDELEAMVVETGPDAPAAALERLEQWEPPQVLGRIPVALVDRAMNVLAGQAHVVDHLHAVVQENRRHTRALNAVSKGYDTATAAYLDVHV